MVEVVWRIFSLVSESFQTSKVLRLNFSDYYTTTIVMDNSLVMVADYKISQYDILTGALLSMRVFRDDGFSRAGTIECSGTVYLSINRTFWMLTRDLTTEYLKTSH